MHIYRNRNHLFILFLLVLSFTFIGCGMEQRAMADTAVPQDTTGNPTIIVDALSAGTAVDPRVRGTNLPAWLGPGRTEDATFIARTKAAQPTVIRIPGGSWSNGYNWLACETGTDIEGNASCGSYGWGLSPTDFINFIREIGVDGMYTINQNGTSKEAAALVAFFNGSTTDDRTIGIDVRGNDWGKVSDWAKLRRDNGNPTPLGLKYWEIGNETYGGNPSSGTDCWEFGWEDVWTCDGTEYVNGIGSGANRREGFIEFRDMMRWVDPTIEVGAVGVAEQASWSNWGNEVIIAAGDEMDFYIIHQYGFWNPPDTDADILAQPQGEWTNIMADVQASISTNAGGRDIPITVTEYNLFSWEDMDSQQKMIRTVNMLFMADTMGQLMENGYDIATHWNLANGAGSTGTDYGMLDANDYHRNPQYYAFPMWAKFGNTMLSTTNPFSASSQLSIYAGRVDADTISILAINKTGGNLSSDIQINGFGCIAGGSADVAQGSTLNAQTATYNGNSNPSNDLSNAPATVIAPTESPFSYTFPPYSITVLLLDVDNPTAEITNDSTAVFPTGVVFDVFVYLPVVLNPESC